MSEVYHVQQLPLFDLAPYPCNDPNKKQCSRCLEWYDICDFSYVGGKNRQRKNRCKECCKDARRKHEHLPEVRERSRQYDRDRYKQNKDYREKCIKQSHNFYHKNRQSILEGQKIKRLARSDEINTRMRAWRKSNVERLRLKDRLYRQSRKEIISARVSEYRKTPRGRAIHNERNRRRNALKRSLPGTFTMEQFYARCEYYGWCCYLCGKTLTKRTVCIEHRIPITRNGSNWPANLAPSCRVCNSRKCNKTEVEYRNWLASCPQDLLKQLGMLKIS